MQSARAATDAADFVPKEGARVWLSDSDLEEMGTLSFRAAEKHFNTMDEDGAILMSSTPFKRVLGGSN